MDGWRIPEDFSTSDHQYIAFKIVYVTFWYAPPRRSLCAWIVTKVNTGRFVETLGASEAALESTPGDAGAVADTVVNWVMNLITIVCAGFMPRRTSRRGKLYMH